MFRRSTSLAIPHSRSFAAIPSVHESQREIVLLKAFSRPIPDYQQGEVGEKKDLCFAGFGFLKFRGPFASHDSSPYWEKLSRGVSKPGGFPHFSGKVWTDCVANPFGTVPRRCCYYAEKEEKNKSGKKIPGQSGKIPKKSGTSR